jgi:hypothetical protein
MIDTREKKANPNQSVSISDAQQKIRTKHHYYQGLLSMGLFLPSEKSSISTQDFLREVREKTVWVPELAKMSFRACVNPPPNASLSVSI